MTTPNGTVMIVDDDALVVDTIQGFLELETGHRVLPYTSPVAALESLGEETIHTILADLMMPEMNGVDFLTRARERQPQATRILLTGYADKQNAIDGINKAGLYQYIEKPWNSASLALAIRNAVERSRLFHELGEKLKELEEVHDELEGLKELKERWERTFL